MTTSLVHIITITLTASFYLTLYASPGFGAITRLGLNNLVDNMALLFKPPFSGRQLF